MRINYKLVNCIFVESNPRRARFFSESLQDQHGNEGDVMAPLDGGNPVSSLRRRDRTQSAPALQTVVEFGQELRRISDNFDREYTTQPNTVSLVIMYKPRPGKFHCCEPSQSGAR